MVAEALESPALSVNEAAIQNSDMVSLPGAQEFDLATSARRVTGQEVGRLAMLGFLTTTLTELLYKHPLVQIVGLR